MPFHQFCRVKVDQCKVNLVKPKNTSYAYPCIFYEQEPALTLLKDVMHTTPFVQCLTDQHEEVQRMKFTIDEYTQAQVEVMFTL